MPERRLLGLAQIGHQGARGLDLQGAVVNAEAVERGRAELLVEGLAGLLGLEVPRGADRDGQCRRGPQRTQPGGVDGQLRDQGLRRVEPGHLIGQLMTQEARQGKAAGGELDPGQPKLRPGFHDRGQIIGRPGIEQSLIGQRSRSHDPDDVALDQTLGQSRVFQLFADRGPQARLDDPGQVRFERGMGEAGHGNGLLSLVSVASGQRDPQQG